jgi:nucleotide-binding universal stress UspA family protein
MLEIRKVLFATDFSESSNRALPYALHFARRYDAELHMLHAVVLHADDPADPTHRFPEAREIDRLLQDLAEARLNAATEGSEAGDLRVERVLRRGISAAPTILDYAEEQDVDLIVIGTHGRRGVRHLLIGSVAEEVVRMADRPVLTVRQTKDEPEYRPIERIVVPTDFSEHAEVALSYAKRLAEPTGARLYLLHAVEDVVYPDFYPPVVTPLPITELRQKAGERIRATIARVEGGGVDLAIEVRAGRPALEIVEFAEQEEADLIVMASHGLTGLRHLLLGSVTEQVIRRAPCPIFTVKAFGKTLV